MRLTSFTDYSLRVLIYLGTHQTEGRLATIGDIAAAYGISENHLMKVVHHLGQQGYVETVRGKGGGMRLALQPSRINIGKVVRAAEQDFAVVKCLERGSNHCPITPACMLRAILGRAVGEFLKVLDGHTLSDLLETRAELAGIFGDARAQR